MKHPSPLYVKILLWFFLNLVVLAVIGFFIFAGRFGIDLLVSGPVATRMAAVSAATTDEFRTRPRSEWNSVLENHSRTYGVKFLLFRDDGTQLAGEPTALPDEVKQNLRGPPGRPGPDGRGREKGRPGEGERRHEPGEFRRDSRVSDGTNIAARPPEPGRSQTSTNAPFRGFPQPRPRFVLRTSKPASYWIGMPAFLGDQTEDLPRFCTLLIVSQSLYGGGLFFDAKPFLMAGGWVLLFSVVFWFPLVHGIKRSLAQMTRATERIAQGRFDGRLRIRRRDELGQLGNAVNLMAERLQGFVSGQKRFLGDTAHELCTPLARIQMVVGILEQRAEASSQPYIQDLRDEVQQTSSLVAELLSFSKASLAGAALKLRPVAVEDLLKRAIQREANPDTDIRIELEADLQALAAPDLLQRALANLLRNAVRYAGGQGPITVSGAREADAILVKISDCGPGVSEEFLQRLFDPFFRVDDARTRESGGVGLGLTIVKTCVEACGGAVTCANRKPTGLEVSLRLKPVP